MGGKPTGWEEPSPPSQRRNMPNFDDGTSLWGNPAQQGRVQGNFGFWCGSFIGFVFRCDSYLIGLGFFTQTIRNQSFFLFRCSQSITFNKSLLIALIKKYIVIVWRLISLIRQRFATQFWHRQGPRLVITPYAFTTKTLSITQKSRVIYIARYLNVHHSFYCNPISETLV